MKRWPHMLTWIIERTNNPQHALKGFIVRQSWSTQCTQLRWNMAFPRAHGAVNELKEVQNEREHNHHICLCVSWFTPRGVPLLCLIYIRTLVCLIQTSCRNTEWICVWLPVVQQLESSSRDEERNARLLLQRRSREAADLVKLSCAGEELNGPERKIAFLAGFRPSTQTI